MQHDYTALDSAIKAALSTGPKKFRDLETEPEIKRQGIKLAAAHNVDITYEHDKKPAWRFIDSRLRALLRKSEIQFGGAGIGWSLTPE